MIILILIRLMILRKIKSWGYLCIISYFIKMHYSLIKSILFKSYNVSIRMSSLFASKLISLGIKIVWALIRIKWLSVRMSWLMKLIILIFVIIILCFWSIKSSLIMNFWKIFIRKTIILIYNIWFIMMNIKTSTYFLIQFRILYSKNTISSIYTDT